MVEKFKASQTIEQNDQHEEDPPYCWRIGGQVTLVDGVCPECGWKKRVVNPTKFFLVFKESAYTSLSDPPHLQFVSRSFFDAMDFLRKEKYPGHIEVWEDGVESTAHRPAAMVAVKHGYKNPTFKVKEPYKTLLEAQG